MTTTANLTCFIGTILALLETAINETHTWHSKYDVSKIQNDGTRVELEQKMGSNKNTSICAAHQF